MYIRSMHTSIYACFECCKRIGYNNQHHEQDSTEKTVRWKSEEEYLGARVVHCRGQTLPRLQRFQRKKKRLSTQIAGWFIGRTGFHPPPRRA